MPVIKQQTGGNGKAKKPSGVLSRIRSVQDYEEDGIKICIYGRSGTGKTTLWSTFPKPILAVISSGAGETRSIKNVSGIEAVAITEEAELSEVAKYYRESSKYKTFVEDHLTGYQDLMLKRVIGEVPAQMSWGVATQQQWGEVAMGMKERLREALALPGNVVLVAQEREFNTEQSLSEVLSPYVNTALSPSLAGWVGPAVDYLVQTYIRLGTVKYKAKVAGKEVEKEREEVQFCLRTAPHPVYSTKFRVPRGTVLPDMIVNPSYDKIMSLINGKGLESS